MDLHLLECLGLTKGESKAYISLLRLGSGTVGGITKESGISPSKIYDVLKRLLEKGLIGQALKGKVKLYRALEPSRLQDYLQMQKEELENKEKLLASLSKELETIYFSVQSNYEAEILEGMRGIKYFFDLSLEKTKKGDEILVIGYPKEASELFNAYFKQFHKWCTRKGVIARVIYDYDTWFFKKREQRNLMEQRYLPKGVTTPTFIYLFKDYVGIITFSTKQKLCFLIKNEEVAKSYQHYFELMWKQAIKT